MPLFLLLAILGFADPVEFKLEIAQTLDELARGLQNHPPLAEDEGMYFILDEPRVASFWMRGMSFPIDIIFIDENGSVDEIAHSVPPCRETPCPLYRSRSIVTHVLEVKAGTARRLNIHPGTPIKVDIERKRARIGLPMKE